MALWSSEIIELESSSGSFREKLPDIWKELNPLLNTDDENIALLYSCRCLEVIITEQMKDLVNALGEQKESWIN